MASVQNVTIYRGEDVQLNFTMSPVEDITAWNIIFTLKQSPSTSALDSIGATITDGPNGLFSVALPNLVTDITAGTYVFDVVRTDLGSNKVLAIGNVTIKSGVRTP